MSSTSSEIVHGYSVLRLTTDDTRGDTTPIGVIAWDSAREWFGTRVLAKDERVVDVPAWARDFIDVTIGQLGRWATEGAVPYEPDEVEPSTERFWRAVSEILSTAVKLDAPMAMDPMSDPDVELEALFEAVVQPRQSRRRRHERIDGALSRALGDLAEQVPARTRVAAFGEAHETVRRGAVTDFGVLLVDGVNLASSEARNSADTLVSRFRRIRAAYQKRPVMIVVGYTASPGGLNGEAHMRDWIRKELTEHVFDLATETDEFREATSVAWRRVTSGFEGTLIS